MRGRSWKQGVFVSVLMAAGACLLAVAHADVLETFTNQGCSVSCGIGPFGTVSVTQNGSNSLNFKVVLGDAYDFHGKGNLNTFLFDIAGAPALTFSNFQASTDGVTFAASSLFATALNQTIGAFGNFDYEVQCATCGPQDRGTDIQGLSFTVTASSALFADFLSGNGHLGCEGTNPCVYSAASIFLDADTAITGPVGATASAVPVPIAGAGLPGLMLACGSLLVLARRRRRQTA